MKIKQTCGKAIVLGVCVVMTASLCGCMESGIRELLGSLTSEESSEVVTSDDSEEIFSDEPETAVLESDEPAGVVCVEVEDEGVKFTLERMSQYIDSDDGNERIYGHEYEEIYVDTEAYPELAATLGKNKTDAEIEAGEYRDEAQGNYELCDEHWQPYYLSNEIDVCRADSQVFSYEEDKYYEIGGPHGTSLYIGCNYDTQTGAEITLDDIITDKDAFVTVLEEKLLEDYPECDFYDNDLSSYITEKLLNGDMKINFVLRYGKVDIMFSEYDLASHADGMQEVTLTYEEYPQILNEEYFASLPQNRAVLLSSIKDNSVDKDMDGITDIISITGTHTTDEYRNDSILIWVNDSVLEYEAPCSYYSPYFVKNDGKSYIYIKIWGDYEDVVAVFDITDDQPALMGEIHGEVRCFAKPECFYMQSREERFDWDAKLTLCEIGEDGMPTELK